MLCTKRWDHHRLHMSGGDSSHSVHVTWQKSLRCFPDSKIIVHLIHTEAVIVCISVKMSPDPTIFSQGHIQTFINRSIFTRREAEAYGSTDTWRNPADFIWMVWAFVQVRMTSY